MPLEWLDREELMRFGVLLDRRPARLQGRRLRSAGRELLLREDARGMDGAAKGECGAGGI